MNITAGLDLSLGEFSEVGATIEDIASEDATVVVGTVIDPEMTDSLKVTVVATGLRNVEVRPSLTAVESKVAARPAPETAITVILTCLRAGVVRPLVESMDRRPSRWKKTWTSNSLMSRRSCGGKLIEELKLSGGVPYSGNCWAMRTGMTVPALVMSRLEEGETPCCGNAPCRSRSDRQE